MPNKIQLHEYQKTALRFALDRDIAGLFLDPGLGKTAIMLSLCDILDALCELGKVLIVAPLRVCSSVWPQEVAFWQQFERFKVSIVGGKNEEERNNALNTDADIYLANPESVVWLSRQNLEGFNVLIVDESTKFKSPRMKTKQKQPTRFAALRSMLDKFERRYILTGTPCPNTLIDLWSQIYILDRGKRLGKNISRYRRRWFNQGFHHNQWFPKPGAKEEIEELISDIVIVMSCKELLDMPELFIRRLNVDIPAKVFKAYKKLESDLFFELDEVSEIAMSSSSTYGMARQVANGGLYVDRDDEGPRKHALTHNAKLDAIADLHEEMNYQPLIVVYHYKHELERLQKRFGFLPHISGGVKSSTVNEIIGKWNRGKLPMIFCQPSSMAHGLNMQKGGRHMVWLGPTDDLEIWLQTIARLWRQGQTGATMIYVVCANGTVDNAIMKNVESKDKTQQDLLESLKQYGRTKR